MICANFPPSRNSPNKIPPSARNIPPRLLLSTVRTSLCARRLFTLVGIRQSHRIVFRLFLCTRIAPHHHPPEADDLLQHFAGTFPNHNFFPADQRQHGVRRRFHELDEIAIDQQPLIVEPRKLNHVSRTRNVPRKHGRPAPSIGNNPARLRPSPRESYERFLIGATRARLLRTARAQPNYAMGCFESEQRRFLQRTSMTTAAEIHAQGLLHFAAGRHQDALASFRSALRESDFSELWNDWAAVQFILGHKDEAEAGFRCALDADRANTLAALNLA